MPRPGDRDYYPDSSDEWIDLDRLREIIAEIESLGGTQITAVDLLNRLGIEDDELDLLKAVRAFIAASGKTSFTPGAADPRAPGRRKANRPADPSA